MLAYGNTPHSTTGEAASQLFLGRQLRTRLDLLKPDLCFKISNHHIGQTVTKGGASTREFSVGQPVIAWNYTGSTKLVPGIIGTQLTRSKCASPQLGLIYELLSDCAYFNKCVVFDFNFQNLITILPALASGEELWCFAPAASSH